MRQLTRLRCMQRSKRPLLDLNFAAVQFSSLITFSRSSAAYYVGADGLLASAASDVPRFTYEPTPKYLHEEQITNLCLWSNDLTNAAWTATNATVAMTATGPDGASNSASIVIAAGANATVLQAITSASASRVVSCYIKRRTGSGTIQLTQDNGSTWTTVSVSSSWAQVTVPVATLTNPTVGIRVVTIGDAVDVWCVQSEATSSVPAPTSPIPTTTASVTRAYDRAVLTGDNFKSIFKAGVAYTILAEYETRATASFSMVFCHAAGASGNEFQLYLSTNGRTVVEPKSGGATQASITQPVTQADKSNAKSAASIAENNVLFASLAGGATGVDYLAAMPAVMPDRASICSPEARGNSASSALSTRLSRIRIWNVKTNEGGLKRLAQ